MAVHERARVGPVAVTGEREQAPGAAGRLDLHGVAREVVDAVAEQDLAGRGRAFEARGDGEHLAGGPRRADERLAGLDPERAEAFRAQLDRRAHGAQRVVLVHRGLPEHGHERVADRALDLPTVALDDRGTGVEAGVQGLRVEPSGEARRHHGHQAARRRRHHLDRRGRRRGLRQAPARGPARGSGARARAASRPARCRGRRRASRARPDRPAARRPAGQRGTARASAARAGPRGMGGRRRAPPARRPARRARRARAWLRTAARSAATRVSSSRAISGCANGS